MATGIVMILSSILVVISLSILALNQEHTVRDLRYFHFQSLVNLSQVNVFAFGQNTHAWRATVAYNKTQSRMLCVDSGGNCPGMTFEPIELRLPDLPAASASGSPYLFQFDPNRNGMRLDGSVCRFDAARITDGCILGINITWRPFCGGSDCLVGPEKVDFNFDYSMPANDQYNNVIRDRAFFLPAYINKQDGGLMSRNPYR